MPRGSHTPHFKLFHSSWIKIFRYENTMNCIRYVIAINFSQSKIPSLPPPHLFLVINTILIILDMKKLCASPQKLINSCNFDPFENLNAFEYKYYILASFFTLSNDTSFSLFNYSNVVTITKIHIHIYTIVCNWKFIPISMISSEILLIKK